MKEKDQATCTRAGCALSATWLMMRQGQPTDTRLCEKHGPKDPATQASRDGYGNRIWKRC